MEGSTNRRAPIKLAVSCTHHSLNLKPNVKVVSILWGCFKLPVSSSVLFFSRRLRRRRSRRRKRCKRLISSTAVLPLPAAALVRPSRRTRSRATIGRSDLPSSIRRPLSSVRRCQQRLGMIICVGCPGPHVIFVKAMKVKVRFSLPSWTTTVKSHRRTHQ